MDTVSWEWTAFEYKDSNGLRVTSFFSLCFDRVLLIITSPTSHTHILTGGKGHNSRQDLPYAELPYVTGAM